MPPIAQVGLIEDNEIQIDTNLINALTPNMHWSGRAAREIAASPDGFAEVTSLCPSAPDIVASLGAARR
ncbi:hypothetical protein [uncultured Marivita sp.]|uniref:hypothetical protein n=1 Tax=uncultured Marivita sp. TaxID=888080 RepID=UPI002611029A|nr:hypothetical protein [uncultured Marivita sp.]